PVPKSDLRGSGRSPTRGRASVGQSARLGGCRVAGRTTGGGHTPSGFAVMTPQGTPVANGGRPLPVGGPRRVPIEGFPAEACGWIVAEAGVVAAARITSARSARLGRSIY